MQRPLNLIYKHLYTSKLCLTLKEELNPIKQLY
jgi:hypothetical protein